MHPEPPQLLCGTPLLRHEGNCSVSCPLLSALCGINCKAKLLRATTIFEKKTFWSSLIPISYDHTVLVLRGQAECGEGKTHHLKAAFEQVLSQVFVALNVTAILCGPSHKRHPRDGETKAYGQGHTAGRCQSFDLSPSQSKCPFYPTL